MKSKMFFKSLLSSWRHRNGVNDIKECRVPLTKYIPFNAGLSDIQQMTIFFSFSCSLITHPHQETYMYRKAKRIFLHIKFWNHVRIRSTFCIYCRFSFIFLQYYLLQSRLSKFTFESIKSCLCHHIFAFNNFCQSSWYEFNLFQVSERHGNVKTVI